MESDGSHPERAHHHHHHHHKKKKKRRASHDSLPSATSDPPQPVGSRSQVLRYLLLGTTAFLIVILFVAGEQLKFLRDATQGSAHRPAGTSTAEALMETERIRTAKAQAQARAMKRLALESDQERWLKESQRFWRGRKRKGERDEDTEVFIADT
eukprot:Sspe_Gene.51554::Locus_28622_Transcript_2_4_Confidence_0.444_Length_995::g.51554::m.51554